MIWLKALHLAAIAIWSGGLICLPSLYVQRAHVADKAALHRLHALVRYLYVVIISPAAFTAVASGTLLIFVQQSFEGWFSLKLALVGMMVTIHILTGLVIIRLFDVGEVYPVWRFLAVTAVTLAVVCAVLVIVLAKPDIPNLLPSVFSEPGALSRLLEPFNPFRR
jgi:putative membrane protein